MVNEIGMSFVNNSKRFYLRTKIHQDADQIRIDILNIAIVNFKQNEDLSPVRIDITKRITQFNINRIRLFI